MKIITDLKIVQENGYLTIQILRQEIQPQIFKRTLDGKDWQMVGELGTKGQPEVEEIKLGPF